VLEASRSEDEGAQASISYVASCGWLALTHAELGEFERHTSQSGAEATAGASRRELIPFYKSLLRPGGRTRGKGALPPQRCRRAGPRLRDWMPLQTS
jgi:hypothetical protein